MPEPITPGSDASHDEHKEGSEGRNSKSYAAKDRECPFCHQKFTSSSLGRHLDQFLNKKKPDATHDVAQILRIRGSITRRTARHSSKNEHDEPRTTDASPAPPQQSPSGPMVDTLNVMPVNGIEARLNSMNWHSTGVINNLKDIPSMPNTNASPISTLVSTKRNYSTFAGVDQPTTRPSAVDSEKDTTIRALELSLREVLDSVRAAAARAAPRPSPFTFDLQAQTFPSLVLHLLPMPPTLFSATPFATSTSAPLDPPDSSHLSLVRLNLETKIQTWKWDTLRHAQSQTFPTAQSSNLGEETDYLAHTASQYEDFSRKHLDAAFHAWTSLSPSEHQQKWTLELLRAFASKSQQVVDLAQKFESLTAEANRLQAQVEHLSHCQWPREMALWPPERHTRFSKVASDELRGVNLDMCEGNEFARSGGDRQTSTTEDLDERWDYERLLGKWKRRVREDRTRRSGMLAATGIPAPASASRSSMVHHREEGEGSASATPSLTLVNGECDGDVGGHERSRKQVRQILSQQPQPQSQHLATGLADQDERAREFNKRLGIEV